MWSAWHPLLVSAFEFQRSSLFAQGTDLGTIRGTVTDSSGAVVAGAKVAITDLGTGSIRETETNARRWLSGFRSAAPALTRSRVANAGMTTVQVNGIVVNGSAVVIANAVMKVAASSEVVSVTTEAPTIDTADQTISDTITSREMVDLPRDSRDIYSFLYLNPNITQSAGDGSFKFLGFQSYGANFTIDGQRSTSTLDGSPSASAPSLEAVGELNVLSNDFSAEYAGISSIRVTTKRGSNQFHGSAFYNNKNSALAGLTIQDQQGIRDSQGSLYPYPYPYFNLNDLGRFFWRSHPGLKEDLVFHGLRAELQPGFGPDDRHQIAPSFILDWGFFAVDHQSRRYEAEYSSCRSGGRDSDAGGDRSGYLLCRLAKLHRRRAISSSKFPLQLLNPNVQQLISTYFPKIDPSIPINTSNGRIGTLFQTLMPSNTTRDLGTLRIDHDFSDRDHVYGVYNTQAFSGGNSAVRSPFTGLGLTQQDQRTHTLSASYVRTIRNNIINEARGGFNREFVFRHSNTTLGELLVQHRLRSECDRCLRRGCRAQGSCYTHGHPVITFGSALRHFRSQWQTGIRIVRRANTWRPLATRLPGSSRITT